METFSSVDLQKNKNQEEERLDLIWIWFQEGWSIVEEKRGGVKEICCHSNDIQVYSKLNRVLGGLGDSSAVQDNHQKTCRLNYSTNKQQGTRQQTHSV